MATEVTSAVFDDEEWSYLWDDLDYDGDEDQNDELDSTPLCAPLQAGAELDEIPW